MRGHAKSSSGSSPKWSRCERGGGESPLFIAMNLKDINESIYELESGQSTYQSCHRLASLYTVRDHLQPVQQPPPMQYSGADKSEFADVEKDKLIAIFDELMETLKLLQPRLYDGVMRRLKE